jgi:acyl-coenzyme A synthetase/AMP-(fatty) acid ligase
LAIFLNSDILENVGSDSGKCGCTNMAIWEFLAERLADYEIPRKFALLKEFSKTESGKIRKKEL